MRRCARKLTTTWKRHGSAMLLTAPQPSAHVVRKDQGVKMTLDLNKQKLMVDPPSGWMYGFPVLWDKSIHPQLEDLLRDMK